MARSKKPKADGQPRRAAPADAAPGIADEPGNEAGGRPTLYRPEFCEQARRICERFGATDLDLAEVFGVSLRTIGHWKVEHEAFAAAIALGKGPPDDRVERSLYHRAVGYTYDAVKIFMPANADAPVYAPYREHVPPDTTAAITWLKNRRPDEWREKVEHEHSGRMTLEQLVAESFKPGAGT